MEVCFGFFEIVTPWGATPILDDADDSDGHDIDTFWFVIMVITMLVYSICAPRISSLSYRHCFMSLCILASGLVSNDVVAPI